MTNRAANEVPNQRLWAGGLLVAFGVVVAANYVVAVVRGMETSSLDLAFAVLLLVATGGAARGLRAGWKWAWLGGLAISLGGLFFVAPVVGTILLGGGTEPVGTGWDIVYFPLMTVLLVTVIVILVRGGGRTGRTAGDG